MKPGCTAMAGCFILFALGVFLIPLARAVEHTRRPHDVAAIESKVPAVPDMKFATGVREQ